MEINIAVKLRNPFVFCVIAVPFSFIKTHLPIFIITMNTFIIHVFDLKSRNTQKQLVISYNFFLSFLLLLYIFIILFASIKMIETCMMHLLFGNSKPVRTFTDKDFKKQTGGCYVSTIGNHRRICQRNIRFPW